MPTPRNTKYRIIPVTAPGAQCISRPIGERRCQEAAVFAIRFAPPPTRLIEHWCDEHGVNRLVTLGVGNCDNPAEWRAMVHLKPEPTPAEYQTALAEAVQMVTLLADVAESLSGLIKAIREKAVGWERLATPAQPDEDPTAPGPFTWKGRPCQPYGELLNRLMAIQSPTEMRDFIDAYATWLADNGISSGGSRSIAIGNCKHVIGWAGPATAAELRYLLRQAVGLEVY